MTLENNYICQIDSAKEIQNIANNQNMDYSNSVVDLCGNTPRLPSNDSENLKLFQKSEMFAKNLKN